MKTIFHTLLLPAFCLVMSGAAISCVDTESTEPTTSRINLVFTSDMHFDGMDIDIPGSSSISLYDHNPGGSKFVTSKEEASKRMRYAGTVTESDMYYAVYPYSRVSQWEGDEGLKATFQLPDVQIAVEGDIPEEAKVFVAKCSSSEKFFHFVPALAFVKVTIDGDSPLVRSIDLASLSGKSLSGCFTVGFKDADFPFCECIEAGKSKVTLQSFDNECPLDAGTYYLAIAPGIYPKGDLEVTYHYTNGKSKSEVFDTYNKYSASLANSLGTIIPNEESGPQTINDPDASKIEDKYDVFLLIGQSNMAGLGPLTSADRKETVDGVYLLDSYMAGFAGDYATYSGPKDYDQKPVPAVHPFNQYSTIRKSLPAQQMNPGYGFATTVRDYNKARGYTRPILIVCNARGGSSITEWQPGMEYYIEAVRRTKIAMKYGTLKGILWHQGCSNCSSTYVGSASSSNYYPKLLKKVVDGLRKDLHAADVLFIAGQLPAWRSSSPAFNSIIIKIKDMDLDGDGKPDIRNADCVSSDGVTGPGYWLKDASDPHWNRAGQIEMGKRYGEKVIEMVYK